MSADGDQRSGDEPDKPDYKVYRSGESSGKSAPPPKRSSKGSGGDKGGSGGEGGGGSGGGPGKGGGSGSSGGSGGGSGAGGGGAGAGKGGERPDYKVYRSRPGLFDRFNKPDLSSLRRGGGRGGGGLRDRFSSRGGGGRRPWVRWILIGAAGWLALSFLAFAVSAQIQKSKLPDGASEQLEGGPDVLAGQNILILGGDRRGTEGAGSLEKGEEGQGAPRADTIMVLHASLTSFRKLSIPRDTLAEIEGCGQQKINASLACNAEGNEGNPGLVISTVADFLGIDINHIVIVDFAGFADLINTLGGIKVDLPSKVCASISGGKANGGVTLKLKKGEHTLEGEKALALARTRKNECNPSEDDRDRAARQQLILNGIKGRLTDPFRAPYNFVKGPLIGWNAPRAFISDMGGVTMPQVAVAAMFGGNDKTNVLKPSGESGGALVVSQQDCNRAVRKLLGGDPDREPACSPGG